MHTLTYETRKTITRKVWLVWTVKRALAPLLFVLFAWLLSTLVSLSNVMRAGLESAGSPASFWAFVVSAVSNAGVIVLGITALVLALGAVCLKNILKSGVLGISLALRKVTQFS